ncbi:MAG: hypothetical protein ACIAZJ_02155 [Gimesia chilikensis]|uniref:hypothetical protein n=1 Tax=Gimesia chilikensis TaxID=2605989 RepID=UPI00379B2FAD
MTEPEQPAKYTPPQIAYGIDIGMYRTGKSENVLSTTTFAWGRVEAAAKLKSKIENGKRVFSISPDSSENRGNDISELVESIRTDLNNGKRIALGMEAPMWQPVPALTQDSKSEYDLFVARFDEESKYQWYLQSGAAALAKALSIGKLLLTLLDDDNTLNEVSFSLTDSEKANIELYEGFVAGDWKLDQSETSELSDHCWDALVTAIGFHYAKREVNKEKEEQIATIHSANTEDRTVISHWHTILDDLNSKSEDSNSDCLVVGFYKHNEKLHEQTDINLKP